MYTVAMWLCLCVYAVCHMRKRGIIPSHAHTLQSIIISIYYIVHAGPRFLHREHHTIFVLSHGVGFKSGWSTKIILATQNNAHQYMWFVGVCMHGCVCVRERESQCPRYRV